MEPKNYDTRVSAYVTVRIICNKYLVELFLPAIHRINVTTITLRPPQEKLPSYIYTDTSQSGLINHIISAQASSKF